MKLDEFLLFNFQGCNKPIFPRISTYPDYFILKLVKRNLNGGDFYEIMNILNGKTASTNIPLTNLTKPTTTTKISATPEIPTRYSTLRCENNLPAKENLPFEIEPTLPFEPTLTENNLPTTLLLANPDPTNPSDSEDDYSSVLEEFVC